jgi:Isochorismatase family
MRPGIEGVEIHPEVFPADGEPVVEKSNPNAFLDTRLQHAVRRRTSSSATGPSRAMSFTVPSWPRSPTAMRR